MLYIEIKNGQAIAATTEYPHGVEWRRGPGRDADGFETRNDWSTFERAEQVARELNEVERAEVYVAIDNGDHVYPRYDVIERPMVGDAVSYGFNGDYYPDGKVAKVSGQNFRIVTTDTGSVYYRRKLTGRWVKKGGTWTLVRGHRNERNPHF